LEIFIAIIAILLFIGILAGLISKYAWLENKVDSDINNSSQLDKYKTYDWKL
jgi:hypothetical protein